MTSLPTTQQGVFIDTSEPSYKVQEFPVTKPGPGQVLVKVKAVAVNPTDWKIVKFGVAKPGFGIGDDFAGEIVALGEDVKGFAVGDRVAGWVHGGFSPTQFAFQQYLPTRTDLLLKLPPNITYENASSIPVAATTTVLGLNRLVGFPKRPPLGKTILVYGGASAVGMSAIQFASLTGLRVIATSSPHNHPLLKSLGAHSVIDYHSPSCVSEILSAAGPSGVDYAFDAISFGDSLRVVTEVLKAKEGGKRRAVTVLPVGGDVLDAGVEYLPVGIQTVFDVPFQFLGVNIPPIPEDYEIAKVMYRTLNDWISKGIWKNIPVDVREGGIGGIPEGILYVMAGKVSGSKLVYKIE